MTHLADLFPARVRCVFSSRPPEKFSLLAAEADATRTMREKRLREFVHGRACARRVLEQLGFPDCPVPVSESRAPVWPDGIVGSISHCGDHAAAVAALKTDRKGLGIDLEVDEALDESLIPMVCRPAELDCLQTANAGSITPKLIFSAKESFFKCVWPILLRFIDFQEIEIRLDTESRSFTAIPRSKQLPHELAVKVRGRYTQAGGLIITAAYL